MLNVERKNFLNLRGVWEVWGVSGLRITTPASSEIKLNVRLEDLLLHVLVIIVRLKL